MTEQHIPAGPPKKKSLKDRLNDFDRFLGKYGTPISYALATVGGGALTLYVVESNQLLGSRRTVRILAEEFSDIILDRDAHLMAVHEIAKDALTFIQHDTGEVEAFLRKHPQYAQALMEHYVESKK